MCSVATRTKCSGNKAIVLTNHTSIYYSCLSHKSRLCLVSTMAFIMQKGFLQSWAFLEVALWEEHILNSRSTLGHRYAVGHKYSPSSWKRNKSMLWSALSNALSDQHSSGCSRWWGYAPGVKAHGGCWQQEQKGWRFQPAFPEARAESSLPHLGLITVRSSASKLSLWVVSHGDRTHV